MLFEQLLRWQKLNWKRHLLSFPIYEITLDCGICVVILNFFGNHQTIILVKGNQVSIERLMIRCRKTKPVLWIQAIRGIFLP